MKRKGFTLIELLVVIAIIAMLMAILVPALAKARSLAQQLLCATNLRGIGSAMALYAHEHEEEYPRAGGPGAIWGSTGAIMMFFAEDEADAFQGGTATISSCLYLLVKYGLTTPKLFVCKGDDGIRVYKPTDARMPPPRTLAGAWDFGGGIWVWPGDCVSYSYHMPLNIDFEIPGYPISEGSREDTPLCADRNPHLDENVTSPGINDNAFAHGGNGQNVVYKDAHVNFEDNPRVGLGISGSDERDNIWTYGGDPDLGGGDPDGSPPQNAGDGAPEGIKDSYLVNEIQHP